MNSKTPPPPPQSADEEDYVSSEDEDFNPTTDAVDVDGDESSESEADAEQARQPVKKVAKKAKTEEAEDVGFENSGDEAVMKKGQKRKKRDKTDEDSDGEGGFVKTRSMKAVEEVKKKQPLSSSEAATIDVDTIWQSMKSKKPLAKAVSMPETSTAQTTAPIFQKDEPLQTENEEMVAVKKTYTFAGETVTSTELVPKSVAKASKYTLVRQKPSCTPPNYIAANRPLKFISRFQPQIDLNSRESSGTGGGGADKGPKLNVVDKSKLDWYSYVEQEGLGDELKMAGKSKTGYLDRTDFLGNIEAKKEEEMRRARMK